MSRERDCQARTGSPAHLPIRNEGETKAFKATPGGWDILRAVLEADGNDRRGGLRREKGRRAKITA